MANSKSITVKGKGGKQPLTEMQQKFLHHLMYDTKGDVREAMRLAGYSDSTQQRAVLVTLQDEIVNMAKMMLSQSSIKAVNALVETLDNPGKLGQSNAVAAAKEILDRIGVTKPQDQGMINIKADNIMILPPKVKSKLSNDKVVVDNVDYEVVDEEDINRDLSFDDIKTDELTEFDEDSNEFEDEFDPLELESNEFDQVNDIVDVDIDFNQDDDS